MLGAQANQLVKSGYTGGFQVPQSELQVAQVARRFNALDVVGEIIAKIIDPREWAALMAGWHAERARRVKEEQQHACVGNAVAMLEALPPNSEGHRTLAALQCCR